MTGVAQHEPLDLDRLSSNLGYGRLRSMGYILSWPVCYRVLPHRSTKRCSSARIYAVFWFLRWLRSHSSIIWARSGGRSQTQIWSMLASRFLSSAHTTRRYSHQSRIWASYPAKHSQHLVILRSLNTAFGSSSQTGATGAYGQLLALPEIPKELIDVWRIRSTFTGYIDIEARHLFFYFFESRSDPATDDVIFWTNGGPGCSSTVGLLMELGE